MSPECYCRGCRQPIGDTDTFCRACGTDQRVQPQHTSSVPFNPKPRYYDPRYAAPSEPAANEFAIRFMWLLTSAEIVLTLAYGATAIGLTVLLDIPAIILALMLLFSGNHTSFKHGIAKLILEAIAFALAFFAAAPH